MRTHYQLTVIAGSLLASIAAMHGCGSDTNEQESGGAGGAGAGTAGATSIGGGGSGATPGGHAGSTSAGNAATGGHAGTDASAGNGAAGGGAVMSFFVTSDKNASGNLGGLVGADARCRALATAAGSESGLWHAYLSAEVDPENGNQPTNARDRIGHGPWYNANGRLLANDITELHRLSGNVELFVDEHGNPIPGQWAGSPSPVEHDVLTGSSPEGTVLVGFTCESWTSAATSIAAQVGHSDGLGPSMNPNSPYNSWNSSHANESCANTAPRGGAGRLYCFLVQ